jgi:hypothetical protein
MISANSVGHLMTSFESHYAKMLDKGLEAEVDGMTSPEVTPHGDRALYRAVFRGMQVHGLPEELTVAGAMLRFRQGPALVQKTGLSQRAGYPLVFDKSMSHGVLVGEGHWLTLVEIEIDDYAGASNETISEARQHAESAVAFVAAILDERVGQEMLAENLLIFAGEKPVAVADLRELVRNYPPFEGRETERDALAALGDLKLSRHVDTAARWYLRGVQAGPNVDGVIFLWFAVEALAGTSKKKLIEEALRRAGRDPADQGLTVGELHGLRSSFVHNRPDSEPPTAEKVKQGFYDLEAMVKTLLRHELGVRSTWPAHSASRVFHPPWQERVEEAWSNPKVEFHERLPGSETEPTEGLDWGEMLPAIETKGKVVVTGGQGQDANMVRRIVEIALLYFGDPDGGEFRVAIKKPGDPAAVADCRADELVVSPRLLPPKDELEALRLQRLIHVLVGRCLLAKTGVDPNAPQGPFLHGVLSGWVGVNFFSSRGVPGEVLSANRLPDQPSPFVLGEHLGSVIAGCETNLSNFIEAMAESSGADPRAVGDELKALLVGLEKAVTPAEMLKALSEDADE